MLSDESGNADRIRALSPEQRKLLEYRLGHRAGKESPAAITPRHDRATAPLSLDQERLWFIDQIVPGASAYNINSGQLLTGALDRAAMTRAVEEMVRRHEILRTTFHWMEDEPLQCIHAADEYRVELNREDLSDLPAAERQSTLDARITELANAPFDLADGPVLRASLLRLEETKHVLLVTMPHIVCDNLSLRIFERELAELYRAFHSGRSPRLPEIRIQYGDFTAWQREYLQGDKMDALMRHWQDELDGAPLVLDLPTDRPRAAVQNLDGQRRYFRFPRRLHDRLVSLASGERASPFMLYIAAFSALLSRYSGQKDILIGTPFSNRDRMETQNLLGYLLNMLPIRIDMHGNPMFRELLHRVRRFAVRAYANHELPFGKLLDLLDPPVDLSRNPIVQSSFIYLDNTEGQHGFDPSGLQARPLSMDLRGSRFDLTLIINMSTDALTGFFEYSTELWEAESIDRMIGCFEKILEGIVEDLDTPIDLLSILSGPQRRQILCEWNRTSRDYPKDITLARLFEAQVALTPEAIAVEFADQSLSYRELDERAVTLAQQLQQNGIGPEQLVGVYMLRSLEMVIALVAILKAGGAYLPLDPDYPRDRIAYMAGEARLGVVLTQQHLQAGLADTEAAIVCVDNRQLEAGSNSAPLQSPGATADDLAYVIYTSGSTGKPKGVMNCHRGIVNRLQWMQQTFPLQADDRVLQKTPFSFDVSLWEIFWPLIAGARLVVAEPDGHKDPVYLSGLIRDKKISNLHFVPSMLKVFLDNTETADFSRVKRVFCSGEALPYELQQQFFDRHDAELHNLYGPTEAAIEVSYWACRRNDDRPVVPIGRPIANTRLYLLDHRMQPVPVGINGELHIGGVQVARGYLGQPELTAEKFVPDPFSEQPAARLYKTGDLARYLDDGSIEYVGRIDNQIKLRGYRIELAEIETLLVQRAEISDAIVIASEDAAGDKRLIAYLVLAPERQQQILPNEDTDFAGSLAKKPSQPELIPELRRHLRRQLPAYMLPSLFVVLDEIPLNANGKLDRQALPDPEDIRSGLEVEYTAPRNGVEALIAGIWADVLGLESVGIHDNFFDAGGHSLKAVQVARRIGEQLNVELPLVDLFTYATVDALTNRIVNPESLAGTRSREEEWVKNMAAGKQRLKRLQQSRRRSLARGFESGEA